MRRQVLSLSADLSPGLNMVRITSDEQDHCFVLRIAGSLRGPWVAELERVWQSKRGPAEQVRIHLEDVSYVDDAAKALLRRMVEDGVKLFAAGPMMTAIVQEIEQCAGHPGVSENIVVE